MTSAYAKTAGCFILAYLSHTVPRARLRADAGPEAAASQRAQPEPDPTWLQHAATYRLKKKRKNSYKRNDKTKNRIENRLMSEI